MTRFLLLLVTILSACGDGCSDGPIATYDVPASGAIDWSDAPFPNDLFLGTDGTVDIASLPSTLPLWETVRTQLNERRGFCGTCAIHFPVSGAIDPATVANGVLLIDDGGAKVSIDAEWDATHSVIAMRPKRGIVLEPGQKYTAGLTNAIRDLDGNSLRAADGFSSARAGTITDAAAAALKAAGANGTVVSATTFTVDDPAVFAKELAARVTGYFTANGAPVVTVERIWRETDGTLTDLLGTPAEALPGLDNPAMAGTIGKYGITNDTSAIVIKGTYTSVRVISGAGKDLGMLQPETVAGDTVPFVLAIPQGVDVTNLPVLVFGHGAGGMVPHVLALADIAGRAHAAVIAHETFQHGERATSGVDAEHAMRGDGGELGPDGFFEHTGTSVLLRLLAVDGTPIDQKCSPLYVQGTIAQAAADLHALVTMVVSSNLAPIAGADASLTGFAFDPDRIFYLGVSLGTVYGSVMLAGDTRISAAALNVPVASLSEAFVENEVFRTQVELFMLDPWAIPNEDYEPERHLIMNPMMALHEWALSGISPIALVRENVSKSGRDMLFQIAGLDEAAGTPGGQGLVAAAGVPAVGEFTHGTVTPGTAPIQGSGAWLFPQADHIMIGYQKGTSKFEPPGLPPFVTRTTPLMFENPIQAVYDQLTHFYDTRRATGVAEIR